MHVDSVRVYFIQAKKLKPITFKCQKLIWHEDIAIRSGILPRLGDTLLWGINLNYLACGQAVRQCPWTSCLLGMKNILVLSISQNINNSYVHLSWLHIVAFYVVSLALPGSSSCSSGYSKWTQSPIHRSSSSWLWLFLKHAWQVRH